MKERSRAVHSRNAQAEDSASKFDFQNPRLVALTEAVEAVVHHQITTGTCMDPSRCERAFQCRRRVRTQYDKSLFALSRTTNH